MKNFIKFVLVTLMNQRGEMGDTGLEKYMDDANLEGLMTEGADAVVGPEGGQAKEQPPEGDDLESRLDALKLEEGEGGEPQSNILEEINSLGILRNGLPAEFDDVEKVKEYLSKGFDYTQKTQELADERKQAETELSEKTEAFESQVKEFETSKVEFQQNLQQHHIMAEMFAHLSKADPGLFEELNQMYMDHESKFMAQQNNPEINALKNQIGELENRLNANTETDVEKENNEIRTQWESGLKETQSEWAGKLKSLGVVPNWAKVQEAWKADTTNSLTVRAALMAVHGDAISKALDAKANLATKKQKTTARVGTSVKQSQEIPQTSSKNNYMDYASELADKYANI